LKTGSQKNCTTKCPKSILADTRDIEGKYKMNMTLAILYAPEGHKPLSIARINDHSLLSAAAERAISEAEATATELMETDSTLGAVQFEEANKLRRVVTTRQVSRVVHRKCYVAADRGGRGGEGMNNQSDKHPEVFTLSEPINFGNTRKVYPPRADARGRFRVSELMLWFIFMNEVLAFVSRVCCFFKAEIASISSENQPSAQNCIREMEGLMPIFRRRDPELIADQQRSKDLCVVLCTELMVWAGHQDCIQTFSKYIAGSDEDWQFFSRAVMENGLLGQRDWRHATSPAKWVKTTTNNLASKEYWLPEYAVDPETNKESVGLEEVAETPCEAIVEQKYTQRSIAKLELAAMEDSELAEYVSAKVRYPDWRREDIWIGNN
jgi:hypothetical protein